MEFIWNDGGRAACGYAGLAGDCVTRAIAIATGAVYRDVYTELGKAACKSPRNGVLTDVSADHLATRGWLRSSGFLKQFDEENLPKGVVIVHLVQLAARKAHLCTVIDHVIHDTWNPSEDDGYVIQNKWQLEESQLGADSTALRPQPQRQVSREQELTQHEFDKILRRLRALDSTASNDASTEGEKHNALRMMQNLMLRHNLSRDDIAGDDNVDSVQFTRMTCPVNGRRACTWEGMLARYVTEVIFPTVQWYQSTRGHRTFFWFYGPLADVRNTISLFRELLLTIATSAHLLYGSHLRGSGASYAEGYVIGLPRSANDSSQHVNTEQAGTTQQAHAVGANNQSLIQTRTMILQQAATDWLRLECNIKLVMNSRSGRNDHDASAASRGKQHGASHKLDIPGTRKRLN